MIPRDLDPSWVTHCYNVGSQPSTRNIAQYVFVEVRGQEMGEVESGERSREFFRIRKSGLTHQFLA